MTKRILAVDDSPSIRKMVGFTLRSAGYEVVEAEDVVLGVGPGAHEVVGERAAVVDAA